MALQVIVATCVLVFVATAAITLLGITKKISIAPGYLRPLYTALILEIVSVGVFAFRSDIMSPQTVPFVRLTTPIDNISLGPSTSVVAAGVAQVPGKASLACNYAVDNRPFVPAAVQVSAKGLFGFSIGAANETLPFRLRVRCAVTENGKAMTADSTVATVSR